MIKNKKDIFHGLNLMHIYNSKLFKLFIKNKESELLNLMSVLLKNLQLKTKLISFLYFLKLTLISLGFFSNFKILIKSYKT